jgi:hypothetical protein
MRSPALEGAIRIMTCTNILTESRKNSVGCIALGTVHLSDIARKRGSTVTNNCRLSLL